VVFDFTTMNITAGTDVAFVTALMRCTGMEARERIELEFRLTIGLRKIGSQWLITHEHHSIPAFIESTEAMQISLDLGTP